MQAEEVLAALATTGAAPADGEAAVRLSAGIGDALDRIVEETFPFIAAGGGDLKFIHAPYGRGKTHFLRALQHRARQCGFVTAWVDCQDHGGPFQDLGDTYRAIARNMTPPVDDPDGRTGAGPIIEYRFDSDRVGANEFLSPDYRNLVRSYLAVAISGDDESLRGSLESLLNAWSGDRVAPGALNRAYRWLPRPLGKLGPRNAGLWLRCLLSLPNALGYPGLLVLFDETETALNRGGPRAIQRRLAHMRTFVDHLAVGAVRGCAVWCAALDGFVDDAREHLEALSQRIERSRLPGQEGDEDRVNGARNPRAVWVALDELTEPDASDPQFYAEIAKRIADLGMEAGMSEQGRRRVLDRLERRAPDHVESIHEGRVREYVKIAAEHVAREAFGP